MTGRAPPPHRGRLVLVLFGIAVIAVAAWLLLRAPSPPATRMAFGGITDPQERADLMLYLNRQGGSLPVPAGAR